MANVKAAADAAKNLAKQYKAVLDIVEVLDELGNLELAKKEALAAAEKAREGGASSQAELRSVEALLEVEEGKLAALNHKVKEADFSTVAAAARDDASTIVAEAMKTASRIANDSDAAEKERTKRYNDVAVKRTARIERLVEDEAKLTSSIDALQKTIDRMRAKFD